MSQSAGVLQKLVAEKGFSITADEIEKLSPALQGRLQAWLDGDRVFPRFLTPYYCDETVSITLFTDSEDWTTEELAEEIADTFTVLGVAVASPDRAIELISQYTADEADEAGGWTLSVHLESARAAEENRDAHAIQCPECVMRLLKVDAESVAQSVPATVQSSPPATGETREQAIARIQASLHDVRRRYLDRRETYEDLKESAANAKKAMESAQETLNDLIGELDDAINCEVWQARLPLKYDEGTATVEITQPSVDDPAKTASIENLVEFGISQKQAEKLIEADIETVAKLEKRIREVNGWFRKIKGIGESAADKIADALIGWRLKYGYAATGNE
ncbi:MAG: phage integrase family protein [Flavobacteriales bacterium]